MDVIGLIGLAILLWFCCGIFWSYIVALFTFFAVGFGVCLFFFGMGSINIWGGVMGVLSLIVGWLFWGHFRYTRIAIALGVMIFSITAAPVVFLYEFLTTGLALTPQNVLAKNAWERQWVIPDVGFFDLFTNSAYRDYIAAVRPLEILGFFELCVALAWLAILFPAWLAMRDFKSGNTMQGTCYGYFDDGDYPPDAKPVRHKFPYFS